MQQDEQQGEGSDPKKDAKEVRCSSRMPLDHDHTGKTKLANISIHHIYIYISYNQQSELIGRSRSEPIGTCRLGWIGVKDFIAPVIHDSEW